MDMGRAASQATDIPTIQQQLTADNETHSFSGEENTLTFLETQDNQFSTVGNVTLTVHCPQRINPYYFDELLTSPVVTYPLSAIMTRSPVCIYNPQIMTS